MAPTEDGLGNNIFPRPGFVYPEDGSEIVVVRRFETSTSRAEDRWIEPGTIGTVIGRREPGYNDDKSHAGGHVGLIVHFKAVARTYPAGMVIPWDKASSDTFEYHPPASAVQNNTPA